MTNDPFQKRYSSTRDGKQEVDWILEPFKKDVMQALPKADELYKQMS